MQLTELYWPELNWIELNCFYLTWLTWLEFIKLNWTEVNWCELCWPLSTKSGYMQSPSRFIQNFDLTVYLTHYITSVEPSQCTPQHTLFIQLRRFKWALNMFYFVHVLIDYTTIFYPGLILQIWCDFLLQAMTPQHFLFEVHIVVDVCGLPPCFKYSQDDRHSIYLDVYCFELLGMGNARPGIHIRKKPIWTSSSGENTRMT